MPVTSPAKSQAKPSILRTKLSPSVGIHSDLVTDDAARRHRRIGGPDQGEADQGDGAGQPRGGVARVGGQQPGGDRAREREADDGRRSKASGIVSYGEVSQRDGGRVTTWNAARLSSGKVGRPDLDQLDGKPPGGCSMMGARAERGIRLDGTGRVAARHFSLRMQALWPAPNPSW